MPSSISNSDRDRRAAHAATLGLLSVISALYVAVELFAARAYPRISKIEERIQAEYEHVRSLPPARNGTPTLLLVGNSLPLEAVNIKILSRDLSPHYDVHRFVVEGTTYLDWYFGLRRLFQEGCRPTVVVVSMSTDHLLFSSLQRGSYFARYLMRAGDIVAVKKAAHLDTTTASTLWLAHWSPWLARQSGIRGGILKRLVPNLDTVGTRLSQPTPQQPSEDAIEAAVLARLLALKQVSDAQRVRLIVVVPPRPDPTGHSRALISAGAKAGVPVLVPYAPAEMPMGQFRDGIHLTAEGAALFTPRLAEQLLTVLAERHHPDLARQRTVGPQELLLYGAAQRTIHWPSQD